MSELTAKYVQAVVKLKDEARQFRFTADKFSDAVARFCGSVVFLWTHAAWFSMRNGVAGSVV